MIKVSEVKARLGKGFKFVEGDKLTFDGVAIETMDSITESIFNGIYSKSLNTTCITEFAPRPNTGTQPVGDDVMIIIENSNGEAFTREAGDEMLEWGRSCMHKIVSWKPCIKWLTEQANKMSMSVTPESLEIPTETPEEKGEFDGVELSEFTIRPNGEAYDPIKPTTSAKHDQDKPMYNLLPANAIDALARVLTFGAKKYGANTWQDLEDGLERYRAALLRHTFAIQRGELIDEESGLHHSSLAMCCAAFINELEGK